MRCTPLDAVPLADLLGRARERDRLEMLALTGSPMPDPADLAADLAGGSGWGCIVWDAEGAPQAALGAVQAPIPGVWTWWLHTTDRWGAVWRTAYCWARGVVWPAMEASSDVRRVQAMAMADQPDAIRFLEAIGLRRESVLAGFCADGRDVVQLVWVRGRA
jgi:hypothetical protein